jgi:hypothetical protein
MAISTVAQVRSRSNALGSARLLLLVIASHVNPSTGFAWPSLALLAAECKLSARHVRRLLRKLEASGELETFHRPGRTSYYRIKLTTSGTTPDTITPHTSDIRLTAERNESQDIALPRLETWLTPGSLVWRMLSDG